MKKEEILFQIRQIDKEIELKNQQRVFLFKQLEQVDVFEKEIQSDKQLLQE